MSAVGTTLLQSPGWNEGKARNETLGKQRTQKLRAPSGAALQRKHLPYVSEVSPLQGSKNVLTIYYPGLAPWARQECRPCRAHLCFHHQYTLLFWWGCSVFLCGE